MPAKKKNLKRLPTFKLSIFVALILVLLTSGYLVYNSFAATPIPTPCLGGTIKQGSKGSCVLAAKKALNYICKNKDLNTKNSTFDQNMKYRVLGFQSSANIATQDGIIGKGTWSIIYKRITNYSPNNLSCYERHIDK